MTRIDYTELERERKLRIETQMALLEEQARRLQGEREMLLRSILARSGAEASVEKAVFYADRVEIPEE